MIARLNALVTITILLRMTSSYEPCPTQGMSVYALFTITEDVVLEGFRDLLNHYKGMTPYGRLEYSLYFGGQLMSNPDDDLVAAIDRWLSSDQTLGRLYASSLISSAVANHSDAIVGQNCSTKCAQQNAQTLLDQIDSANRDALRTTRKKQFILVTDYIHTDVIELLNAATLNNLDVFGLYYEYNNLLRLYLKYQSFTMRDDASVIRAVVTRTIDYSMPSDVAAEMGWSTGVWVMGEFDTSLFATAVLSAFSTGSSCVLADADLAAHFTRVVYRDAVNTSTVRERWLPWIGANTYSYAAYCLSSVVDNGIGEKESVGDATVYSDLLATFRNISDPTYFALVSTISSLSLFLYGSPPELENTDHLTIISDLDSKELFEKITYQLEQSSIPLLSPTRDVQIISFNTSYMALNNLTLCKDPYSKVALLEPQVFHKPKVLKVALFDLVWITALAGTVAILVGVLIYWRARRAAIAQDKEDAVQLVHFPASRTFPSTDSADRMQWEVKESRVKMDLTTVLGEGLRANVYLGHLIGKAPLMQWNPNSSFSDCDIAIRVTREYGMQEEDELSREISGMQRLRGHAHISMFLGWATLNGAVCSLLQLHPIILNKYLCQLKNTMTTGVVELAREHIVEKLREISEGVACGLDYIHSRHLVHRDVCARNILLSADMQAKIAGLEYCSSPKDAKFRAGSDVLQRLPLRWQAPEALHAEFSYKSDVWSFGMLLYEVYSLGDHPLAALVDDADAARAIHAGFATETPLLYPPTIWSKAAKVWNHSPSSRPTMARLKTILSSAAKTNAAFEDDDDQ